MVDLRKSRKVIDHEKRALAFEKLHKSKRVGVKDAAFILGVTPATIRDYIYLGKLHAFMLGNRAWITEEEINYFFENGLRKPEPEPEPELPSTSTDD